MFSVGLLIRLSSHDCSCLLAPRKSFDILALYKSDYYYYYYYLPTKWHLDPSSRLATTDMGQKLGTAMPLFRGWELGLHLTQCGLGRGLALYQMASWSIQPFGQWLQYTNVTGRQDRTDRQTNNGPIGYGEPFYKQSPKNQWFFYALLRVGPWENSHPHLWQLTPWEKELNWGWIRWQHPSPNHSLSFSTDMRLIIFHYCDKWNIAYIGCSSQLR